MNKFDLFWKTMELCDWSKEGNDDKVLKPVIKYLAKQDDSVIFQFDDLMGELLYNLDTKEMIERCKKFEGKTSDDSFLYSRCVALINGPEFYDQVLKGYDGLWEMEFESMIYVPQNAWAMKHKADTDDYPHTAPFSFETGSNKDGWK